MSLGKSLPTLILTSFPPPPCPLILGHMDSREGLASAGEWSPLPSLPREGEAPGRKGVQENAVPVDSTFRLVQGKRVANGRVSQKGAPTLGLQVSSKYQFQPPPLVPGTLSSERKLYSLGKPGRRKYNLPPALTYSMPCPLVQCSKFRIPQAGLQSLPLFSRRQEGNHLCSSTVLLMG